MPFFNYWSGFSISILISFLIVELGLDYNLVFISVNGASNIIAIYLAESALKEYLKNLFNNGISV